MAAAVQVPAAGPVVDPHQHFWDPSANDHPCLRPDAHIPFRYGRYDAIKRRYLPPDYRADAQGHISRSPRHLTQQATPHRAAVSTCQRSSRCRSRAIPPTAIAPTTAISIIPA